MRAQYAEPRNPATAIVGAADQVRAYTWSEPVPDEMLDGWFLFGPSESPIIE